MINEEYVKHPTFVPLLQFETSTKCDGACTFCNHRIMKRHGTASWSTLLEIIDTCAPFAQTCCPFLMGEPLLEPRLLSLLDNVKQVNPHINTQIYTNMNSMTMQKAHDIIESQLLDTMIISFYGPTPELYHKYQPAFKWARTRKNIKNFMKTRSKLGLTKPHVTMHYIALPDLLHNYKNFRHEWSRIVDSIGVTVYRSHTAEEEKEARLYQQAIHGKPALRVPCYRAWTGFYTLFNGDVVPCSADYEGDNIIGNIHDTYAPMDIWWGEKAQAFRQLHMEQRQNEIPMCANCNYWKYEMPPEWVAYWTAKYEGKSEPLQLEPVAR